MAWITYVLATGDFPGLAVTGLEEDHPVIVFLLALHALIAG